jgi:Kef-type K+ transport system membrane component KefB
VAKEDAKQRRDRELGELLQELRVALPGVQVLFAFLLTVPFSQRFDKLDAGQKRVYFAAVLATAVSSLLLIAPAANHRLLFRDGTKERLLHAANTVAIVGLVTLAVGIGLALFLVTEIVYGGGVAAVVAALVAATTAFFWFLFPRVLHEVEEDHPSGDG